MKPMARNLTMAGVVLLLGASGGIMLGNFVAGSNRVSGADELAAYFSASSDSPGDTIEDEHMSGLATRSGPTSYHCDGCDAGLHKEPEVPEPADYLPLPPYEVIDLIPPARREVPPTPPAARLPPKLGEPAIVSPGGSDARIVLPVPTVPEQVAP